MYDERADILDVYRATPETIQVLLRGVDDDLALTQPEPGEWSIVEVVAHLADVEEVILERFKKILAEDRPALPDFDPDAAARQNDYRSQRLDTCLSRFLDLRAEMLGTMEPLSPEEWDREGIHEDAGPLSIHQMAAHLAAHDSIHLAQMSRILAEQE